MSKEVQKSLEMTPVETLNLKGCSYIKRIYVPTMLKEKNEFVWRIGNEEKALPRKSHKKLPRNRRIEENVAIKKVTKFNRQNWTNCP